MLGFMAALVLGASTQATETLPLGEVRNADPVVLAPRVLPPDVAGRITDGYIRKKWSPGQRYFIGLWERPVVHAAGLCRRTVHIGGASAPKADTNYAPDDTLLQLETFTTTAHYAPTYPQQATDETCQSVKGWIGSSHAQTEATLLMLTRLTDAMKQAAGRRRLGFEISCTSETRGACSNHRRALANLPLDQLLAINLQNTVFRNEPVRNGVQVRTMQPVIDNRWPEAEISFDYSAPDGRSWIVLLKGIDRLEAVEMRRTMVTRH
ncbi:hypothetical protein [Brevundimonas sp. PAMC22021]|uniref:hypothetical protein n=1 Tax=Brevundimonas sp. PAMC22021 TaxID=2861285 RepID=UPI001C62C721|nr:hypothetical protein [Brevundimonas sp. PAMC22021]QYF87459.1 hypothetical protein KY493_02825 [Brevundimonas sp. PAMC22021]